MKSNIDINKMFVKYTELKEKLPETYSKLFQLKQFEKTEEAIKLEFGEAVWIGNKKIANTYPNKEMFIFANHKNKPFLICTCHMN